MKFLLRLILFGASAYLCGLYFSWWIFIIPTALIAALIPGNGLNVFLSSFLGVGLLWMGVTWKLDVETRSIMSSQMVELFPVNDPVYLIIITGILGGLLASFAALSGNSFRKIFMKQKQKSIYN